MKNKYINKILALSLAFATSANMVMPAFAAESEYVDSTASIVETVESTEDSDIDVNVAVSSKYSVKIPKTVILDGQSGIGKYAVSISGDIAGDELVVVTPDSSVTMHQEGKSDITASIEQDKTKWKHNEFETTGQGTIDADLSAGCWNGSFDFNIGIEKAKLEDIKEEGGILVKGTTFCSTIPETATKIVFTNEIAPRDTSLTDVSEEQNNSIVAWLDGTTYKVSNQNSDEYILANPDSSKMFYQKKKLENMNYLAHFL